MTQYFVTCKVPNQNNTFKTLRFKVQSIMTSERIVKAILKQNKTVYRLQVELWLDGKFCKAYRLNSQWYRATNFLMPYLSDFKTPFYRKN